MRWDGVWVGVLCLGLVGCAHGQFDVDASAPRLPTDRPVVILPMLNASTAPMAGERVQAILATHLKQRGITDLRLVEELDPEDAPPELDDGRRYHRALLAAREGGAGWGVTGTVLEWRYRPGLDDSPAVGVSLRIVDIASGRVVWSGTASRGGRGTVAALAQTVLRDLAGALPLGRR